MKATLYGVAAIVARVIAVVGDRSISAQENRTSTRCRYRAGSRSL
jgi:hypothetical protein